VEMESHRINFYDTCSRSFADNFVSPFSRFSMHRMQQQQQQDTHQIIVVINSQQPATFNSKHEIRELSSSQRQMPKKL